MGPGVNCSEERSGEKVNEEVELRTYMYSSMEFRLCIKWIRLQVRSSTKIMCSSFSIRHPLGVSQAS